MNATALAVLGYVAWMLVLLGGIAILRVTVSISRNKPPNSFHPDGADVSPFSERLCRAHANCYESFPPLGGLLLLALAGNMTGITNALAPVLLASRIAQSSVHLASTSVAAVQLRFMFFLIQYVIAVYWVIRFLAW